MQEIIFFFLCNSLLIFGVYKIFDSLLIRLNEIIVGFWGDKVCMPLFLCPPCMASVWGTIAYASVFNPQQGNWLAYPPYIICLCGFNYLIIEWLNKD